MITVGLPVYNSNQIAWLAMESLCNQKTSFDWELIICEEKHSNQCGKSFFEGYGDRLAESGCVRLLYIELNKWVNLPTKWKLMANAADKKSQCFIMQAADCYSSFDRIQLSGEFIINTDYDWYDESNGIFYDVLLRRSIRFNKSLLKSDTWKTGLNMALKTFYVKTLPDTSIIRGVDSYIFKYLTSYNLYAKLFSNNRDNYYSLDTNGLNTLSIFRQQMFINVNVPFEKTNISIEELKIPFDVIHKLKTKTINTVNAGPDIQILMTCNKSNFDKGKKYFVTLGKAQYLSNLNQCEIITNDALATYTPINNEAMQIKLKRRLWNNEADCEMDVNEQNANWAISKGYAEKVEKSTYSTKEEKSVIDNKEADNVPSENKQRGRRGRSSK